MYFSLNTQLTKFPNLPKLSNAPPLLIKHSYACLAPKLHPSIGKLGGYIEVKFSISEKYYVTL